MWRNVGRLLHDGYCSCKALNEREAKSVLRSSPGVIKRLIQQQAKAQSTSKDVQPMPRPKEVLKLRPPIVTVMGHVDHGKTTLLDTLRKTSVAAGEAGGITQHIGAFSVPLSSGRTITFLDTPGHAAFSSMRQRGTNVTDIVVLVVAADEGVMMQTEECINMALEANVSIVVAINKCDKPNVKISELKSQLLRHRVQLEEFGGDVQAVEISALTGMGIENLEEAILAEAEIKETHADYEGEVEGVVIEAKADVHLGPTATVLVRHGLLQRGCFLVADKTWAKIKVMKNENSQQVKSATPSTPVVTVGWKELPQAGDVCLQVNSESRAHEVLRYRAKAAMVFEKPVPSPRKMPKQVENREANTSTKKGINVPLVIRGDVVGSVEALVQQIEKAKPVDMSLEIVRAEVGAVTEGDLEMAKTINGVILCFNAIASKNLAKKAEQYKVPILHHKVIYKLLENLKEHLESLLPTKMTEEVIGEATILKVFELTGKKAAFVGGCRVKQGKLVRNAIYRLYRGAELIHEGNLNGMKRGKEDITEAKKETECGLSYDVNPGWQEDDRVVCFKYVEVPKTLEWNIEF